MIAVEQVGTDQQVLEVAIKDVPLLGLRSCKNAGGGEVWNCQLRQRRDHLQSDPVSICSPLIMHIEQAYELCSRTMKEKAPKSSHLLTRSIRHSLRAMLCRLCVFLEFSSVGPKDHQSQNRVVKLLLELLGLLSLLALLLSVPAAAPAEQTDRCGLRLHGKACCHWQGGGVRCGCT